MNHGKKIYHSLLETLSGYNIWLVDGAYIRKNIDKDFIKFGSNTNKSFIPKKEFWIDIETNPQEHPFFITHLLTKEKVIRNGQNKERASAIANHAEKRERLKYIRKSIPFHKVNNKKIIEKIHINLLKDYDEIKIWLVDGEIVKKNLLLDYALGGHDLIYDFIPNKEIWIEKTIPVLERKFVILHELHERFLMLQGFNYPHAHHKAIILENYFYNHPQKIEDRILLEIKNNKDI